MIKNLLGIIIFLLFFNKVSGQNIEPMMCEGKLPDDLKKSLSEIINNKNQTEFSKNNLVGIYEIFASGKVVYGNRAWQMVNSIGQKIIQSNHLDTNVNFYILRSSMYNAFATDEGYVFATTGLLSQISNEDELAFILCHELSHYILKHNLQRKIQAQESLKKMLKKVKADRKNSKDKVKFSTLDAYLKDIYKFSRMNEFQADSLGLVLYKNAGYNLENILSSAKKLQYQMPLLHESKYNPLLLEPKADLEFLKEVTYACIDEKSYTELSGIKIKLIEDELSEDLSKDTVYSSHPDWRDRYNKLEWYIKKSGVGLSTNTIFLNKETRFQCLSESFLTEYKIGNYLNALSFLLILESDYGSNSNIQQWKGICLSSLYMTYFESGKEIPIKVSTLADSTLFVNHLLRHLFTWNKEEMQAIAFYYNASFSESIDLKKINNFYQKKLGKNIGKLNLIESRDSIKFSDCKKDIYYFTVKKPILTVVKNSIANMDTSGFGKIWTQHDFTQINRDETMGIFSDDIPNAYRYKSTKIDSIILVSPNLLVTPGPNTKEFKNPLVVSEKKTIFSNEIINYGKLNDMYYTNLDYNNKLSLTTEAYNQYYLSIEMITELLIINDKGSCPLSILYADRIIKETKCTKMQFMQIQYYNSRSNFHVGSIFLESVMLPFSLFSCTDLGGIVSQFYTNTKIISIVVDLKDVNINLATLYNSNLKLSNDNLSIAALKIQSDTKSCLINE
ncbi:MAG: M48 family metallopeptidase [bacterium]|nr:M48 family metallopeptidase [bacterium]